MLYGQRCNEINGATSLTYITRSIDLWHQQKSKYSTLISTVPHPQSLTHNPPFFPPLPRNKLQHAPIHINPFPETNPSPTLSAPHPLLSLYRSRCSNSPNMSILDVYFNVLLVRFRCNHSGSVKLYQLNPNRSPEQRK